MDKKKILHYVFIAILILLYLYITTSFETEDVQEVVSNVGDGTYTLIASPSIST